MRLYLRARQAAARISARRLSRVCSSSPGRQQLPSPLPFSIGFSIGFSIEAQSAEAQSAARPLRVCAAGCVHPGVCSRVCAAAWREGAVASGTYGAAALRVCSGERARVGASWPIEKPIEEPIEKPMEKVEQTLPARPGPRGARPRTHAPALRPRGACGQGQGRRRGAHSLQFSISSSFSFRRRTRSRAASCAPRAKLLNRANHFNHNISYQSLIRREDRSMIRLSNLTVL